MTTNEVRSRFLNFFKSKGHTVVPSDSVVPKDDPTVLFTTAGMQQFKPQFLGRDLRYRRAASCQKCLRTDDLDKIGKSDVHHTFFEMLGNFSFGDYFKKEAIAWAWEFLTVDMKLSPDKLWVSVYKDDQEAYDIWLNVMKLPAYRVFKLGDKSNFWPANAQVEGPNGPCGPCSEIFFDYGVNPNCPKGKDCDPDCSCGRFSEIWNLVFTQFNRKDGGVLEPLPAKNIDTGMGLERLVAVMQGKKSNYETDNFQVLLSAVNKEMPGIFENDARIVADHVRAVVFGIADGVIPSNEGRGYVIRKLIIIASDVAARLGVKKPVIDRCVDAVVEVMKAPYPELALKAPGVKEMIQRTEEQYIKVQKERVPEFKEKIGPGKSIAELAETGFFYRDTHGLSIPLIRATLVSVGVSLDKIDAAVAGIERRMDQQREKSRAGSKMTGDVFSDGGLKSDVSKTEFLGYSKLEAEAKILQVIADGNGVKVILDRTPFYAQAGGQMGDAGLIHSKNGTVRIKDTQRINDVYIHEGVLEQGKFNVGETVSAQVDAGRRRSIMRHHTATHLLQAALRETLGTHVQQQGSLVAPDRLRFDFTHPYAVKAREVEEIESRINAFIKNNDPVVTESLPLEVAKQTGALAFFAEKYGQTVRVISIGNYSREFCGGTHVTATGDIEALKIVSEGSVAQGIRRVEAVAGAGPVGEFLKKQQSEDMLKEESQKIKQLEKKKLQARFEQIKSSLDQIVAQAEPINGVKVLTHLAAGLDMESLRKLSDLLKQKLPSAVLILATKSTDDAMLLVTVADDVVKKGVSANEVVAEAAAVMEGSGGGRAQMAQAGSKKSNLVDAALAKARTLVLSKL